MMIRLKNIECWKCGHPFDYTTDIPVEHILSVYCGICEVENVIDLNPYKNREEESYRSPPSTGSAPTIETGHYNFPDTISGQDPDKS